MAGGAHAFLRWGGDGGEAFPSAFSQALLSPLFQNRLVGDRLFHGTSPEQQKVLFGNTARSIGGAPKEVQLRHIGNCMKADPAYGKGVADALGIPASELPK